MLFKMTIYLLKLLEWLQRYIDYKRLANFLYIPYICMKILVASSLLMSPFWYLYLYWNEDSMAPSLIMSSFDLCIYIQGWKKYFARGVPQPFSIEHIMNFISKEGPRKMGEYNLFYLYTVFIYLYSIGW